MFKPLHSITIHYVSDYCPIFPFSTFIPSSCDLIRRYFLIINAFICRSSGLVYVIRAPWFTDKLYSRPVTMFQIFTVNVLCYDCTML